MRAKSRVSSSRVREMRMVLEMKKESFGGRERWDTIPSHMNLRYTHMAYTAIGNRHPFFSSSESFRK